MHSYIFQISTSPISKGNYLSEDEVFVRAEQYIDYCDELSEEERTDVIIQFIRDWLPSEMFEANDDGTFTYVGGYKNWVKEFFIPSVCEAASQMDIEKIGGVGFGSSYEVMRKIDNPLDMPCLFLITDNPNPQNIYTEPAKQSGNFMNDFIRILDGGTRIYIGGVYDYHF